MSIAAVTPNSQSSVFARPAVLTDSPTSLAARIRSLIERTIKNPAIVRLAKHLSQTSTTTQIMD